MIEHEPATPTKRLRYVGENAELYGNWYEVPAHIPLPQAGNFIETNFAGTPNESDEPQGQELEAENPERFENVDELGEMREQLAELNSRLERPDVSRAADAISSTARAMQSSWNISQDLKKLEERATAQVANNQTLSAEAEAHSIAAQKERKKTTDLIAANQKIVNHAFNSYSGELRTLRKNLAEADHEIRMLKKAASENSALLKKAGSIIKSWEAREQ